MFRTATDDTRIALVLGCALPTSGSIARSLELPLVSQHEQLSMWRPGTSTYLGAPAAPG